jgi:putative heme-binding domain-containing protein
MTKVEPVKGNPLRGERLFFGKAHCGDCHMLAGKGGFIGADLSDFAVAHSPEEIREAIVHPNEKLLPGQQVISVETVAGQRLSGPVRNEDNFSLQLQGTDGKFHLLMKSQIAKVERTGHSLMPEDIGTRLSSAELDDLVSYIARYGRRVEGAPASSAAVRKGKEIVKVSKPSPQTR